MLFKHQAQSNLKKQPSPDPPCFFSPVSAFTLSKPENTSPIGYLHTVMVGKIPGLKIYNESESNPIYTE